MLCQKAIYTRASALLLSRYFSGVFPLRPEILHCASSQLGLATFVNAFGLCLAISSCRARQAAQMKTPARRDLDRGSSLRQCVIGRLGTVPFSMPGTLAARLAQSYG